MSTNKFDTVRLIFAWIIGLLIVFVGFTFQDYIGIDDDSIGMIAILILSIMIGARIGMAIYTGKLNGNVSPKRNRLFFLFFIFIAIMGVFSSILQVITDKIFGKNSLWGAIPFAIAFYGAGILLLEKLGILRLLLKEDQSKEIN